jgi:hypothetical protein
MWTEESMSDWWPAIQVKRFSGEAKPAYDKRKAEVVAIISGFRKGRFEGALAEKLDARLDTLLSGDFDDSRADPYGVIGWEARPRTAVMHVVEAA